MRIAALYDIHGNLPALEAVLQEIDALKIDHIVIGGDVLVGPLSRECLERLLEIKTPISFVHGNCELWVLNAMKGRPLPALPENVLENIRWTARQLSLRHKTILEQWLLTCEVETKSFGKMLFCHASPRNAMDIFTKETPAEKLLSIFEIQDADIVICGHTHMQFERKIGKTRLVNAGSVGMPFGKKGAHWLLIKEDVEFRCTEYDFEKAAAIIRDTEYPEAENFATKHILNPPTEEQMLEILRRAEIK